MDSLARWLTEMLKDEKFVSFMKLIEDKRDTCMKKALLEGDTDFTKGKYNAFSWVSNLPAEIIEEKRNEYKINK